MGHLVGDILGCLLSLGFGLVGAWSCGRIATRYDLPHRTWMAIGFVGSLLAVVVVALYVRIRFRGVPRAATG